MCWYWHRSHGSHLCPAGRSDLHINNLVLSCCQRWLKYLLHINYVKLNDSLDDSHSEVPAHKCITLSLGGAEDFERDELPGGRSHLRLKTWSPGNNKNVLTDVDIGRSLKWAKPCVGEKGKLHVNFILASAKIEWIILAEIFQKWVTNPHISQFGPAVIQ